MVMAGMKSGRESGGETLAVTPGRLMEAVGRATPLVASRPWLLAAGFCHGQRLRLAPPCSDASCPCPLCVCIYIYFFLSSCVHLLDNCIFYISLSQTRKKCARFSCIVYKVENKQTNNYERGKQNKTMT